MNSNYMKKIRTSMTTNKCAPFKNLSYSRSSQVYYLSYSGSSQVYFLSYSGSGQVYYTDFLLAAHNTTLVKFTLFSSLCEQRV